MQNPPGERLFRLNQAIAKSGLCSRRKADELIAEGRVKVNGQVVKDYNAAINPSEDILSVDEKKLTIGEFLYIAMYKPAGVVTTCRDERGRRTVMDLLPDNLQHLRPVGRLDLYSEGLLLLSNDGELTQRVTHPIHHLPKSYVVTVKGAILDRDLVQMSSGVRLDEGFTRPAKVKLISRHADISTFEITLAEGKNRQIRRMCDQLGYQVKRLLRLSIGGLQLGQMTPGTWRFLKPHEVTMLYSASSRT